MKQPFDYLDRSNHDSIKYRLAIEKSNKEDVIALSVADSDYESAPAIKDALIQRVQHGAYGYLGMPDTFPSLIVSWYKRRYQTLLDEQWILSAPKVLNALVMIINALTQKKDKILIQTPVYHVFKPAIISNARTVVVNPLKWTENGYRIDFDDFKEKLASGVKVFLLCSPHNPVGRVFSETEIKQMVTLCKEHNVIILADEIHADLIMPGNTFTSVGNYIAMYENMIVVSAPGKTFNVAGMHVAYMVIPHEPYREKVKQEYRRLQIGAPNVMGWTMLDAAYKLCDDWLEAQNKHIHENYCLLKTRVLKWHKNAWIAPLEGTYLTWIDIGFTGLSSTKFTDQLSLHGVIVSDGINFGGDGKRFIRINVACSKTQLEKALSRIEDFLNTIAS